jgi:hypothetical protein
MNYRDLMVELRRSAILAGDRIMEIYEADDFEVRSKSDDSPVTAADEAADALISERLRAAFPDVVLVTEEQADSHDLNAQSFLIVDPLDGTKEFVQRRGDFTVNIALVEDGVPVRGMVYAPAKGRLFYTTATGESVEETGSVRSRNPGEVSPITVRDARQRRAFRGGVEIAPGCGDRRLHLEVRRRGPEKRREFAEILPRGDGRGRYLPASGPHDGMGHGRGRRGAARRGRDMWSGSTTTRPSPTANPASPTGSSSPMRRALS